MCVCVCEYLLGRDGPSVQQSQQTAEGRRSHGGSDAACRPDQVRKQDVDEELL